MASAPGAISSLDFLEPAQGLYHCLLTGFRSATLLEPSHPVGGRTALPHGGRDSSESASASVSPSSPSLTDIVPESVGKSRHGLDLRDRDSEIGNTS